MACYSWAQAQSVEEADNRCVNEGAQRRDGTYCREKAEENGWCSSCWAEIVPAS